jgi:hypothetical protein
VATPLALVVAVTVVPPLVPPAKVPLAPVDGAVKVTVALFTGFPPPSVTLVCKLLVKAVLIVALCGVPAVAAMFAGGPAMFVNENDAFAATPPTEAVTV